MKQVGYKTKIIPSLFLLFFIIFFFSFYVGRFPVDPISVIKILLSKIFKIAPTWTKQAEIIVINIRLPRIIGGAVIGACLSIAGTIFQGIFKNPLVSPDILGSSQGAAFGAAISILYGASYFVVSLNSFFFGLLTVLVVLIASSKFKNNPHLGLILAGIMIGSLFQSATSLVKLTADPTSELPEITYWLMGSLASIDYSDLKLLLPIFIFCFTTLMLSSWQLNILTLEDNEAQSLGMNPKKFRFIIIIIVTLCSSISIAVSGLIGWIGLVIPHFARKICGTDFKTLLPGSALLGSSFLIVVDIFARTIYTSEIPIGILTSFIGIPFFILLLVKGGKQK